MGSCLHCAELIHYDLLLAVLDYELLVDQLHCIVFPVLLESAKEHFREPTRSDQFNYVKMSQTHFPPHLDLAAGFKVNAFSIQSLPTKSVLDE